MQNSLNVIARIKNKSEHLQKQFNYRKSSVAFKNEFSPVGLMKSRQIMQSSMLMRVSVTIF